MKRFQAAFHDSCVPQAIADLFGNIVEANKAFHQLLKREDLQGVNCREFTLDEESTEAAKVVGLLTKQPNWTTTKKYKVEGGCPIWVKVHFSGVHDDQGHLAYILAQVQDTTEQHKLTIDLAEQSKESEQFAYIASHDLREPINLVFGLLTLLQRRCSDQLDDTSKGWLEDAVQSLQLMEQKVDDLLDYSRAGREISQGSFPLGSAIEEAKRALVRKVQESGGSIELLGVHNPTLQGDRSLIAQVFQNLFSNSLKYRRQEVTPEVTVIAEPSDNQMWHIRVTDNGLGFDMQFKDRVFAIFQRLYTVEQYPGTGIGLAIAKKVVDRHHGRIWPESEPGLGTTFHILLPDAQKT